VIITQISLWCVCVLVYDFLSHTRTVVRECFKGDGTSQWKMPKFDPSPHQNPLTNLHKNWYAWLSHGRHPTCKILYRSVQGFLFPRYVILPCFWGDYSFFFVFWGFSIRLQPTPLNGWLHKVRRNTSFRARKCLLGSQWLYLIFRPLNFRKTAISGTDFDWTWFLCGQKPL